MSGVSGGYRDGDCDFCHTASTGVACVYLTCLAHCIVLSFAKGNVDTGFGFGVRQWSPAEVQERRTASRRENGDLGGRWCHSEFHTADEKLRQTGLHERSDRAAVCGHGNNSRHARNQLWQSILTVFTHLETTVVGYEVDVKRCVDGERRVGRGGCSVRGKETKSGRTPLRHLVGGGVMRWLVIVVVTGQLLGHDSASVEY